MSKTVDLIEAAKFASLAALGFVAVRIVMKASDAIKAGANTAAAVVQAAGEVIKTDLNPASDKNLAYTGVNALGSAVTNDPSFNLGNRIWEAFNRDKVAQEKAITQGAPLASDSADVTRQVAAQEGFRASEIKQEDADGKAAALEDTRQQQAKSNFRLSEINQQDGHTQSSVELFLQRLQSAFQ